jgi:hypothetical protein
VGGRGRELLLLLLYERGRAVVVRIEIVIIQEDALRMLVDLPELIVVEGIRKVRIERRVQLMVAFARSR